MLIKGAPEESDKGLSFFITSSAARTLETTHNGYLSVFLMKQHFIDAQLAILDW